MIASFFDSLPEHFALPLGNASHYTSLDFRPLSLGQMIHLLDHALRFKSPQHFEEAIARPLLLKQYHPTSSHKQDKFLLKECPSFWIQHTLHRLIQASLPPMPDESLQRASDGLAVLIEARRLVSWMPAFVERYWMQSTLNYSEAMEAHPDGVTNLYQLQDVLIPPSSLTYIKRVCKPSHLNPPELSKSEAQIPLLMSLWGIGMPSWGALCGYLWRHPEQLQRFGNSQFKEVPLLLEQVATYFKNTERHPPTEGWQSLQDILTWVTQDVSLFPPIETLVLVEGMTEEVLLPVLLTLKEVSSGVRVESCGGKTAMLRHYQRIRPWFRGRVRLILDADGKDVFHAIENALAPDDAVFLIPQGSIEDCYELPLFLEALNQVREGCVPLTPQDFQDWCHVQQGSRFSRSQLYQRFWLGLGLGNFDKTFLAKVISHNLSASPARYADLPKSLLNLVDFVIY